MFDEKEKMWYFKGMSNKQNLTQEELLWKIYENTEKTRRYVFWGRIMSLIYLLLIVVPLILAFIYLPPLLKNTLAPYQEFLGNDPRSQGILNQLEGLKKGGGIEELMKTLKQ